MLPHLLRRWTLRHTAQGAADQPLRIRLQVLCQPPEQRDQAGGLHPGGTGGPDHPVLPEELYRGAVPLLRGLPQPGLHHGIDDPCPVPPPGAVPLQRLYPRQGHPRNVAGTGGTARVSGGPPQCEHRAALGGRAEVPGPGQDKGGHSGPHAANPVPEPAEPGGTGEIPPRPPLRPRWTEYPAHCGSHPGHGLPHPPADPGSL